MASKWRSSSWGAEISLEYGKSLRGYDIAGGRYRVFGSNGPIGWSSEFLANGPGVILGRKGAYRGVNYSADPFFVIDTAYYVVPKSEIDMRWLYYAIRYHKLGEIDDGSPIPSTTRAAVYVEGLDVPPLLEQRAIAEVLGRLDDKIELNRRMNDTLEAMARALFKSWFVDFDPVRANAEKRTCILTGSFAARFPDSYTESKDGRIPYGWSYRPLGELVTLQRGTTYKGGLKGLPGPVLLGLASIERNGGFRDDNLSTYGGPSAANLILGPGDMYASLKDVTQSADLLGAVAKVPSHIKQGRLTQDTVKLAFRSPQTSRHITYQTLLSPEYRHFCKAHATGTTNLGLSRDDFLSYPVVQPNQEVQLLFDNAMDDFEGRSSIAAAENRTLTSLRDTLLPKLISGELRVRTAEKMAEAVA